MLVISMKNLLEVGVHFGHQTRRWDPKMAEYIFQARNGIHIIDLQKTSKKLDEAYAFVKEQVEEGKTVLFVGTKKQAQECMKEAAIKCGMYYVDQRWLGGMLTNFGSIKKSIRKLEIIKKMREEGQLDLLTKKEALMLSRKEEKLELYLGGIKEMHKLPDMMFVLDAVKEKIAIAEARRLGITVVAPLDTNCDPDVVDLPIPGNDDAIRSIHLFCNEMAAAMNEGKAALADANGDDSEPVSAEETEALIAEAVAEGNDEVAETEEA